MSLDQTHYDVAIFSTGLTQSIVSAALALAGLSVIHIDKNDYYADQWASLTLSELLQWAQSLGSTARIEDVNLSFPSSSKADDQAPLQLPDSLASLDRHYAISLAPTLLPATGPSIDCLIRSKVSSYATFRLLERTCVASTSTTTPLTSVPASKEDIFKTKTLSLIAKRKLMKLLMYIGTEDWHSDLAQHPETAQRPFVEYLADAHKMSPELVDAVAYGVCLCATPTETTQVAMARAKAHMQSVGRYGNSAYLVGQYGGASELAQGYCRAAAVKGGMFILAHEITSAKRDAEDTKWEIAIDGIEGKVTADFVVGSDEVLQQLGIAGDPPSGCEKVVLYRAILVLDRPIRFVVPSSNDTPSDATSDSAPSADLPPETGLVVFPPGSISNNTNTVTVLMMGEGTFSCPKGQYVYYIQTEASDHDTRTAQEALQPVVDQVIALTSESAATPPLLQLTYRQLVPLPAASTAPHLSSIPFPPSSTHEPVTSISGLADAAVHQAEKVYYDILAARAPADQCGSTHAEKLQWIHETLERQRVERRRRKRRDPAEFQGRGGRGVDDGVTRSVDDKEQREEEAQGQVVGFFESSVGDGGDDDEDDDDGAEA
ncbi:related to Rab proteins geranylgeranyltransferase component A 2 [Sporisorium reilianum f. sp. reilianum]|uniref:Related to Rab proteins geranylgeranyltransferase component A 2 n=1 Tax=Sporisorium reilianum f. sp. reilianum TaxID=72559 RepID=A0A2N8UGB9_9BASI|nr:related to Rab proteins geranylgeranyltransferase component A 2 [Sporisorium reilianum f. sp. reilianum]